VPAPIIAAGDRIGCQRRENPGTRLEGRAATPPRQPARGLSPGRDRGALTLGYVVIIPVFLAALMVIAQASVWYLARETAIAAARQGADIARTARTPPGQGAAAAVAFASQAAPGFLLRPSASAAGSSAQTVRITVTGHVPSLVPGMVITVTEVVTAPVERFIAAGRPGGRRSVAAGAAGPSLARLMPAAGEWRG
jgi:TadE-like protein